MPLNPGALIMPDYLSDLTARDLPCLIQPASGLVRYWHAVSHSRITFGKEVVVVVSSNSTGFLNRHPRACIITL
jgi:hypothetical protein